MRPLPRHRMRLSSNITVLILGLLAAPWSCRNGDPAASSAARGQAASKEAGAWAPTRTAELFFSTEVNGYVEPCGCTTEPLGGLQRLATLMAGSKVPHGLVDAGNLLFPQHLDALTREQHILKSHIMARAYRQIGALALNVAQADLQAGAPHLRALQQEGAVPFVSANVRPKGSAGPEIARSYVRTLGGIRFGITGVATPEAVAEVSDAVTVIEYAPSLRSEVQVLRKAGAEVVVVLANIGEAGALELARLLPEVDVIVRAPGTPIERDPSPPKQVGPVLVVEAGSQGQYIGRLRFSFGDSAPKRPLLLDDMGAKAKRRRALDEKALAAARVQREAMAANPAMANALKGLDAKIARLSKKLSAPLAASSAPHSPHVRAELLPVAADISHDPTVAKLLAGYYQKLRTMNLEAGDVSRCAPQEGKATFVGNAECAKCHEEAFAFWQESKHAQAWRTLEDDGKHFDLTCVGCHVVGFQKPGGFCRLKDVDGFKDVGCENCHGPGSTHVASEDPSDIVLEAPAKTCTQSCHVPEHSDGFNYETYVKKITGPGHELSAD